jgi:hypothetical protein
VGTSLLLGSTSSNQNNKGKDISTSTTLFSVSINKSGVRAAMGIYKPLLLVDVEQIDAAISTSNEPMKAQADQPTCRFCCASCLGSSARLSFREVTATMDRRYSLNEIVVRLCREDATNRYNTSAKKCARLVKMSWNMRRERSKVG